MLVAKIVDPGHRRLFTWREAGLGALVFSVIALPWYLLVISKNPGLLNYFLKVQTADRMLTNRFNRAQPFWYFLPVLFVGFLPWSYFFAGGLRNSSTCLAGPEPSLFTSSSPSSSSPSTAASSRPTSCRSCRRRHFSPPRSAARCRCRARGA